MNSPGYSGHRKRLKERYSNSSLREWADYEILELILTFAIPRKDTKPLAKALVAKFRSLSGVLDATAEELESIPGISGHSAALMKLIRDVGTVYAAQKMNNSDFISSPELAGTFLKMALKGCRNEEFHALFLDSGHHVIGSRKIQDGTIDRAVVFPRRVVESAIELRAAAVILAHNHPSGSTRASREDIETTRTIKNALQTVDISLLDHIIIARGSYVSLKELGEIS